MSHGTEAIAAAEAQVSAVRDDPAARLALMARLFDGPTGRAPQHRPFRRAGPLGRRLGDPRLGMAGVFLSLRRVLPNRYPLTLDAQHYIADEQRAGRLLDYAVIVPRLQRLYEWSADDLGEARLLELVRDGSPVYAWPFEQRQVWRMEKMPRAARALERITRARGGVPTV
jgi:hypothetical protein